MSARLVVVLGGTGFVGRALVERWRPAVGRLRVVVHRSRPDWLDACKVEARRWDMADPASLDAALDGADVVINLLRPDGSGWLTRLAREAFPRFRQVGVRRTVHAGSIDVYGRTRHRTIDEATICVPRTAYEREHAQLEALVVEHAPGPIVLRLGAVFGIGGTNLASVVDELKTGPAWKIVARRALYGRRRMHLVAVETAADAFRFFALREEDGDHFCLVTDDGAPANDFASIQDCLARALGRRAPTLPALPPVVLRCILSVSGRSNIDPMRRFSGDRLARSGFVAPVTFEASLQAFAQWAASGGDQSL